MENYTIELNEPKTKMLAFMLDNFDFSNFIEENPEIDIQGSIGWYEDNYHSLLNDIAEIKIVNNI
jgi:hypothetical protein